MSHTTPGKASKTKSLNKDLWQTTDYAYKDACFLCGVESFDFDVAASKENTKCTVYSDDSLGNTDWFASYDLDTVWCNPPFSRKIEFLDKAYRDIVNHYSAMACIMIPYEPCTKWFREHVHNKAHTVYVPDGRYNFIDPETGKEIKGVPFTSCFVVFNNLYFTETQYVHFKRGRGNG